MTRRRAVDGIVLLDKPLGLSSNQALQLARRLFNAEKAGHAGSLDPLATGMLPICFGQATKLCGHLLNSSKSYRATAKLGIGTATGDAEGEVLRRSDCSGLTREDLKAALTKFEGRIRQIPPMHSALKHEGRRLYELAREGTEVERQARDLTIHRLELLEWAEGTLVLDVSCSKGTYIRTLVEDIAGTVGQVAHLSALRRTEVSPFPASSMIDLAGLEALSNRGLEALDARLLPLAAAFAGGPKITVDASEAERLARGLAIRKHLPEAFPPDQPLSILSEAGILIGLGVLDGEGRLQPKRWLTQAPIPL